MAAMTLPDRTLCKLLLKAVARQDPSTYEPWQRALMEAGADTVSDWTDKVWLEPLLEALNA